MDGATPRLTKEFRQKIELHLYHARTKGVAQHCEHVGFISLEGFRNHLSGLLTYAKSVDPDYAADRQREFDAINWGILGP